MPSASTRSATLNDRRVGILHLVFGPQGAGKSTHANVLARRVNGMCLSIDTWMLQLFSPDMSSPPNFAWVMQGVRRREARIWITAISAAQQGMDVVLDLGCMKVVDRERSARLAEEASLQLQLHFASADAETSRKRVEARNTEQGDTFVRISANVTGRFGLS